MFEPYLMGQYQYPWRGMTPAPNWQPQTPQVAQGQQVIQGVRFVSGIEEAKNCTIPLGSKALLMDKDRELADVYASLARTELDHYQKFYNQMTRIMTNYRSEHEDLSPELQEFYDWQRTKTMDCMTEVKVLVDSYK